MPNSSRSDATPAYRGYRLQALYTLSRILEPSAELVFQPEGAEDLAILDVNDSWVEVIQVKAYSRNLTLSSLSPKKIDSFFYRVNNLIRQFPGLKISIVSFGEISSEMLCATQSTGQERREISQKLSEYGFLSATEAERLIAQLQLISVQETELKEEVFASLRNLCTGVDPVPAFEMLNFWLYNCAENKRKITQQDIVQRLNDVGQFLAERTAHHSEWFISIVPLKDSEIETQEKEQLSNEFYRGISTRYEHILADVDKPRPNKIEEITQKFKEKQVVIIHGASGQGKTTLAYRYLYESFPNQWRFQIRHIESRQQASRIATALAGQANVIGIPIAVYLDVSPNDADWTELVRQLSVHKSIQVLVTVREEDFRRASISGVELQFSGVDLQFDRVEAQEIYQFLIGTETPAQFLDFDDAWNRFGGEGPLMEFVYLVTQGDSLRERLLQQLRRIQDEIRAGQRSDAELELLRLVSTASAFEARLKVRHLARSLGLNAPQRTFELLENEYLLRRTEDGSLVQGLHPIRSSILADILTEPVFSPWVDSASACLPFIVEQDVGSFLLYAFVRRQSEIEPLLHAIDSYQPEQWVAMAGVVRALIWLGVKEYVQANQQLIAEAYADASHGWAFILNFDIADATPGSAASFLTTLASVLSEERRQWIETLRNRQQDRSQVFVRAATWLSRCTREPAPPQFDVDWTGMAETLFWLGRLEVDYPAADWLSHISFDDTIDALPIDVLADVVLGLFYGYEEGYRSWLDRNYLRLLDRFRRETQTTAWEDDGQNIRSHFLIELLPPGASLSEAQPNENATQRRFIDEAMERLRLLRRLLPDRGRYGCQGYGHQIWVNAAPHDDTEKNIPRENFPLQWLTSINFTFKALAEQDFRPDTWEEYAQNVFDLRQTIFRALQLLKQGLEVYFRRQQVTQILGESVDSEQWDRCQQLLKNPPYLPRCAFDEWGFVTDQTDQSATAGGDNLFKQQALALEKYNDYSKIFNEYTRTLSNFFNQSISVLIVNPHLRDRTNFRAREVAEQSNTQRDARLSLLNLGDAWKTLPKLQQEFISLLSQFVNIKELNNLERQEQKIFRETWCSWYCFAFHPSRRLQNATQECTRQFDNKVREIRNCIRRQLRALTSDNLQISILSEDTAWKEDKCFWLVVDGEQALDVYTSIERIILAIRRSISLVENTELQHYAITLTWSYIVVVPLVRGRSLGVTAWRFASLLFSVDNSQNELGWWNFVPVSIPSKAFSQLELSTWTHPRIEVANNLLASLAQLSILASHIKDFERLPETDEQGQEQLQQYLQQLASPMSDVFQSVLDLEKEIAEFFNELSTAEQEERPSLIAAMQKLVELHNQIMPTSECHDGEIIRASMGLTQIAEWASRLETLQQQAFLLYIFWVSDVLDDAGRI